MNRRSFTKRALQGAVALPILPSCLAGQENEKLTGLAHYFAQVTPSKQGEIPEGKAIPFHWDYFTIAPEAPVTFQWNALPEEGVKSVWLRIASAKDIRPGCRIKAVLAQSREELGEFDIQFGYMCQLFEVPIAVQKLSAIAKEGIALEMVEGKGDVWFFQEGTATPQDAALLTPHLLLVEKLDWQNTWQKQLLSYNSIQFFGWAEGVTLDGLDATASFAGEAISRKWFDNHFNLFLNAQQQFEYTSVDNTVKVQQMDTVEGVLPFAVLAKYQPEHPTISAIIQFCETHANEHGVIADGDPNSQRHVSTEANYTISYPLAVIAQQLDKPELFELAAKTILGRKKELTDETGIYQSGREGNPKHFKNWGRGVAWYVLGIARTLEYLPDTLPQKTALEDELKHAFELIAPFQADDGLFPVFLHEPATGTETSGAAGIAAAIAIANKLGLANSQTQSMFDKIMQGLSQHFTPDGFMKNVVQHNAGGRKLQVEGYRTISQYALGFYAIIQQYSTA